jgi:hypothetical protein
MGEPVVVEVGRVEMADHRLGLLEKGKVRRVQEVGLLGPDLRLFVRGLDPGVARLDPLDHPHEMGHDPFESVHMRGGLRSRLPLGALADGILDARLHCLEPVDHRMP